MSTFNGKILEIPEISVDCFENANNLDSLVYFLSHCHTDHMRGLSDWRFQNSLLERPDVYLYATPISVRILNHRYPQLEAKLIEIATSNSTLIKIPYKNTHLTVTALPAGHCPGSVMFLFETASKNILYTGDYRVSASDLRKYNAFYSMGEVKRIDKMYLDTTFFNRSYFKLPPRSDSISKICTVIDKWIKQSPAHIINIKPSATYGSEFLFMEISKIVGMPIHVNSKTYNLYKRIPEMDETVTLSATTQLHANCGSEFKEICKKDKALIRTIIPSTLYWKNRNTDSDCIEIGETGCYRVCYSCHASLEEIEEFLSFLKPVEVEPCVVPSSPREKEEMFDLLEKVMSTYQSRRLEEEEESKLFKQVENAPNTPEKSECEWDDVLGSPVNNFKRKRLWLQDDDGDE
ncbi:hypothetical protein PPYR_13548 [Photinus pyralis]|uniref:Protein artemis n=1 Tax=Photinus pyralis TaxID=7054 RepID=A0A1Y1N5K8_PHOPY|nr:protein artemis [Photinus pyralis]KAB0793928.1 hypothetical protein PPYR_13548 [Photinus pyralis]